MERVRPTTAKGGNYFATPSSLSFVHTGSKLLDLVLGGGWAMRRIANIVGDKSTGKTLLCIEAAANFAMQYPKGRIIYREAEAAFDEEYAGALGMPIDRVEFDERLETVEDLFEDLDQLANKSRKQPLLYILDSLDALSDRAELKRGIDEGTFGAQKAKKMSELFRRCVVRLEEGNITLLIVSQVRDKIGVAFGDKHSRSGGRALDFYASQVVYLAHMGTLTKTVNKIKRPIGVSIKAKCKKNKVSLPFRECEFDIEFGYGIDDERACAEWLKSVGETPPKDNLQAFTQRKWYEVEQSFLPTRRKYNGK